MTSIAIDDQIYDVDSLSDAAKQQVVHIQFADSEIQSLQFRLALAQTARTAYAEALRAMLAK